MAIIVGADPQAGLTAEQVLQNAFLLAVEQVLRESLAITGGGLGGAQVASPAGAQTTGAFVDLSAVPKFHVTDTGTADTEFAVPHNLGGVPTFALLLPHVGQTVGGYLYASGTTWSASTAYLKFSGANANIWVGLV